MVLGLGWPRGVGMVRKWKWYPLTESSGKREDNSILATTEEGMLAEITCRQR